MTMRGMLLAFVLTICLPGLASAADGKDDANAYIGKWKTYDDETGKPMSITEIYRTKSGSIAAKVVQTLNKPNATCDKCSGDRKGKPITGMVVFWGLKQNNGYWGGNGFKPSTGMSFKVKRVQLLEGGRKLEITGCKLVFCRTVTWERVK